MSADAKIWQQPDGSWRGLHDGACREDCGSAQERSTLPEILELIEQCGGYHYAWEFRTYPDGVGLVGVMAGGSPVRNILRSKEVAIQ
jgi:hypothetical protein